MDKLKKLEKLIGSAKFAVIIILIFAIALIYGTFMESYHGVEYANRLVYKSPLFMILQLCMFLSIFISTLLRLPYRKSLLGFYVLHLGLLMIFSGSFITYQAGIDGSMPLPPNTPARSINLNEDILLITKNSEEITYTLPFTSGAKNLNQKIKDEYEVLDYYPFADEIVKWKNSLSQTGLQNSGQYLLSNKMFTEKLTFSLHQLSDFKSAARLGPLKVNYLPKGFSECFAREQSDFLLWDSMRQTCVKDVFWEKKKTETNTEIVLAMNDNLKEVFVPKFGPFPVYIEKEKLLPKSVSPFRLFDRTKFKEKPHLFIFGNSMAYYEQDSEKWVKKNLKPEQKESLPWMGFELKLLKFSETQFPVLEPIPVKPIQDNGELITGKTKAIKLKIKNSNSSKTVWLKNSQPLKVTLNGQEYRISLQKSSVTLPFQITLDKFKMDTDPGTKSPASYESFITLFQNGESENHHIFMNNPLKYLGLTFYQASYFQTNSGQTGSVLSINYDPGRFLKYLGSLLLVLGSFWHFVIRRKLISLKER